MARLETQINQIYLTPAETQKVSLILFQEQLTPTLELFFLAELRDIQKRTEANDLDKIAEIVVGTFTNNRKLPAATILEASLTEINDKLGDFAHKGRKSWLGKFSALIALKTEKDIYLTNSGQTCAWLKRGKDLMEVLPAEKSGQHPLKTFASFSAGRLLEDDAFILASSSIFNYISLELFSKQLHSLPLEQACQKTADILKDSARPQEGFAVFMLKMQKKSVAAPAPAPEPIPAPVKSQPAVRAAAPSVARKPTTTQDIYAPMPEDIELEQSQTRAPLLGRFKLPRLSLPAWNWRGLPAKLPEIKMLSRMSGPAKFFLVTFIIFVILFALNIAAYSVRSSNRKQQEAFDQQAARLVTLLDGVGPALIIRNETQARQLIGEAEQQLAQMEAMDSEQAEPYRKTFQDLHNQVYRIAVVNDPAKAADLQYPAEFIARAGSGFLLSGPNPNSVVTYETEARPIFALNKTDADISGLAHVSGQGNFVAAGNQIYFIDQSQNQYLSKLAVSNGDLRGLKFLDPNRLYTINKTNNQVLRLTASGSNITAQANILRTNLNLQDVADFGLDADIYLLYPDHITRLVNGQPREQQLAPLPDPATGLTRIFVGSQLYLLEPTKNRVLVFSKAGALASQVYFPTLNKMTNLYVDEAQRSMYLLNDNQIYKITF